MDPFSGVASSLNTSIKILEISFLLKAVGEQTTDLLRTAEHVDRNVIEARRLYRSKDSSLNTHTKSWMDSQIEDCEAALREIQNLLEPARVDTQTSRSISGKNRALWVLRDNAKVKLKLDRLNACHSTLNNIIGILHSKDVVVVAPVAIGNQTGENPPAYNDDMQAIFNWRGMRQRSTSSTRLKESFSSSPLMTHAPSIPSMSDPSTPSHTGGQPLLQPSVGFQRPPLVSSVSDGMTAKAAPSWMYSSYDGFDGLQVVEPSISNPLPLRPQTFATNQQITEPPPSYLDSYNVNSPPILPNVLEGRVNTEDEKNSIPTSLPVTIVSSAEPAPRPLATTSGRQWLAYYATRSDFGIGQGDPRGGG